MAKRGVDPVRKFASLVLDGKTYRLIYSFNSIAMAEKSAECSLLAGLTNLGDMTANQLRGLLYGALLVAQPHITIDQVGDMIRLDNLDAITEALAEAYRLSLPEPKKDPIPAEVPPATPTAEQDAA